MGSGWPFDSAHGKPVRPHLRQAGSTPHTADEKTSSLRASRSNPEARYRHSGRTHPSARFRIAVRLPTRQTKKPRHCEHREAIHVSPQQARRCNKPRWPVLDCRSTQLTAGHVGLRPPRNDGQIQRLCEHREAIHVSPQQARRCNKPRWPVLDCRSTQLTAGHVGLRPPRNDGKIQRHCEHREAIQKPATGTAAELTPMAGSGLPRRSSPSSQ